jgi:L-rhamnose mutarotase
MILETVDGFSFDEKLRADAANPKVREWEDLMWKYQQALPMSKPGEKWQLMDRIFKLTDAH